MRQQLYVIRWVFPILMLLLTVFLGYFIHQAQFSILLGGYTLLFLAYIGTVTFFCGARQQLTYFTWLIHGALIFALPNLSPDFYRFLWDGDITLSGIHPYGFTPNDLVDQGMVMTAYQQELWEGMTELSKQNYSVYPTVNQWYFVLSNLLSESVRLNALIMRVLMLFSYAILMFYGRKILIMLYLDSTRMFLFLLNPLVIIECTGNMHFEVVQFSFLVMAFYYMMKEKFVVGAVIFAIAVNVKLTPLIVLPMVMHWKGVIIAMRFWILTSFFSGALIGLYLWPSMAPNFLQSIQLYFSNFEFNSSVFSLLQWGGQFIWGHDSIGIVGPWLSRISTFIIIVLALRQPLKNDQKFFTFSLAAYTVFLAFSTTVHPWYIIVPMGIMVFTKYRFYWVWSYFVIWSYAFYEIQLAGWSNDWMIALTTVQYAAVIVAWYYLDVRKQPPQKITL
jgi:alpha-1,6-mannosyltransferase